MKKKAIAILLATICLFSLTVAASAAAPSKTTNDLSTVVGFVGNGTVSTENLIVSLALEIPAVTAQIQKLQEYIDTGALPASFFGEDALEKIKVKLPEGITVEQLAVNELVTAYVKNYEEGMGDVIVSFTFATQYQDDQTLVAVIGVFDADGNVTWYVLDTKVEDGLVLITFPVDVLKILNGQAFALAILSAE